MKLLDYPLLKLWMLLKWLLQPKKKNLGVLEQVLRQDKLLGKLMLLLPLLATLLIYGEGASTLALGYVSRT